MNTTKTNGHQPTKSVDNPTPPPNWGSVIRGAVMSTTKIKTEKDTDTKDPLYDWAKSIQAENEKYRAERRNEHIKAEAYEVIADILFPEPPVIKSIEPTDKQICEKVIKDFNQVCGVMRVVERLTHEEKPDLSALLIERNI